MSQHDFNVDNGTGGAVRADIVAALQALATNNSGNAPPPVTYPYMWWPDTATGVLKQRNAGNTAWLVRGALAETLGAVRAANLVLAPGDFGRCIIASGSWTQTFAGAATLGDGWFVQYRNQGSGVITLAPSAGEFIDGVAAIRLAPGDSCEIRCTGTAFHTIGRAGTPPGTIAFFATATPPAGWMKANGAAVSRSAYADLFAALVTSAGFSQQSVTISIASPAVFTKAAHGFSGGERVRLNTTGTLPTGLNANADYFVEKIDANTFYLQASPGGGRVASSGVQSGVHSYMQSLWGLGDGVTTFSLPDIRAEFLRGWDDGRGVDSGRVLGSAQADELRAHSHTVRTYLGTAGVGVANSGSSAPGPYDVAGGALPTGGAETRPRNIALLACIKY